MTDIENTEPETTATAATTAPDDVTTPPAPPVPTKTFRDLGVDERIAEALAAGGISTPFPIQAATIPVALSGADVIGQAKTGTGKTLAFGIPVLQRMTAGGGNTAAQADASLSDIVAAAEAITAAADVPAPRGGRNNRRGSAKSTATSNGPRVPGRPLALIVVPTRELAVQVTEDLAAAGKVMAARVLSVYGGRAYEPQIAALAAGIDVVVGTPGRLLDLNKQGHLDLSGVGMLVLDEADEMLDLGFLPDVERIVSQLPASRQTLLFSATMPGQVIALARQYMSRPTHIRAADPHDSGSTVTNVTQHVYRAHALDKIEMLAKMLQAEGRGLTMVFCRTKRTAAKVAEDLDERGYASAAVHGDLGQGAREQALRAFRNGKVDVLVATDVAARGIDVEAVTHVVNFQCPEDEKTYLHRIGRTARAGASGTAVTFVDWDEVPRWNLINKALGLSFHEPPETYSTSESFHTDLKIPAGSKGRLRKADQTRAGLAAEEIEDLGETGRGAGSRQRAAGPGRGERSDRGDRPERGERPARAKRERTRTRGAQRSGTAGEMTEAPQAVDDATSDVRSERTDRTERTERSKRSRTRTRSGAGRLAPDNFAEQVAEKLAEKATGTPAAEAPTVVAEAAVVETPAVEKPKRARTRKSAAEQAAEVVETAAAPSTGTETGTGAETQAEKPKRTRTRKAATSAETAPVADAVVSEAPTTEKPQRARTAAKKTAAPAETSTDGTEAAKRVRTRKPAGLTATGEAATGNYNS